MKILNKAKNRDIQAEAKVAFTAGPGIDVTAEANVGIARSNIETNTETTIQVSWAGGGHIKPMDQQWDIKSLMQAAARFPDLVADCPQRTHAILTKYETLRSFVEGSQPGSLHFSSKNKESGLYPFVEDMTPFEASIKGLSDARIAIRRQMARIVKEVTLIEGDPKIATDEDHHEPFQSPVAFELRLPEVGTPETFKKASLPLTGKRIIAKTQTEQEHKDSVDEQEQLENLPPLYTASEDISTDEPSSLDKVKEERPGICTNLRVTAPAGSPDRGTSFNNLDFLQPDWNLTKIRIEIAWGAVQAFWLHSDNGLIISRGKTNNGKMVEMSGFAMGERIIAATVHTGSSVFREEPHVLSLNLYTNRGRSVIGQASKISKSGKEQERDNCTYYNVSIKSFDSPFKDSNLKGFWGRSDESGKTGIWILSIIWGDINKDAENAIESDDGATLWSQTESAKEECLRSERAALWGNRSSSWRNDKVQFYHIIYHGQTITSDEVAKKFLDCATAQTTITGWLPGQFGLDRDPAPGVSNASYIFYRYNDTGPLRVLREGENWDPLPS
ncbi:hypothetical protein JMJ35_001677 [Cladonia borealis]|uniref:Uncharacterized protein n=1 Tax=Cladonia borealis TaxID=184061 RepID=A0AA39R696_9LECA|nr:hypothetical protein JMJ35_001677 [Cladonia borealis]